MHTIKLNVQDNIYRHVMFFLQNLNKNELEIIEDKTIEKEISQINQIDKTFDSIKIDMKNFRFDRDKANER